MFKDIIRGVKTQATEWKKAFAIGINKGLVSRIQELLQIQNSYKSIRKGQTTEWGGGTKGNTKWSI